MKFAVPAKFCRSFLFQILRGLLLVPREIEKKTYAKVCGENQSINQFINVNTWDGVAPIIRARGSCKTKQINCKM